ncbi:hypothetical protein ABE237_04755 [Brevibacillus formosus]|nr:MULTISPECIES: hypothetical protein [Brevibacillus]MBG9945875.1 hypothetical protein [Brevibacillus formosus]MED1944135.1 hypothetical protein [Brevibacillus formosus]MED1999493.1 hypothetical protein [Brevibacillus formosus]MED2082370.1 hypothetical protein [Brevibacillus formosus]
MKRHLSAGDADVVDVDAADVVVAAAGVVVVLALAPVAVPASSHAAALASSHALSYEWRDFRTINRMKCPARMTSWQGFCFSSWHVRQRILHKMTMIHDVAKG